MLRIVLKERSATRGAGTGARASSRSAETGWKRPAIVIRCGLDGTVKDQTRLDLDIMGEPGLYLGPGTSRHGHRPVSELGAPTAYTYFAPTWAYQPIASACST